MNRLFSRVLPSVGALAFLMAAPANAQDVVDDAAEDTSEEIVVTGTLLRGAAPVGSAIISVGQEEIAAQGATTANELLATIPQVSNLFNTVPSSRLNVAPNQIQVVRPNLRALTGETGSSSSTLVLFDGHRIAGVGVTQSAVDPDIVPTARLSGLKSLPMADRPRMARMLSVASSTLLSAVSDRARVQSRQRHCERNYLCASGSRESGRECLRFL